MAHDTNWMFEERIGDLHVRFGKNDRLQQYHIAFNHKPCKHIVIIMHDYKWTWHNKDRVWYRPCQVATASRACGSGDALDAAETLFSIVVWHSRKEKCGKPEES